jgi:hypothetical protein
VRKKEINDIRLESVYEEIDTPECDDHKLMLFIPDAFRPPHLEQTLITASLDGRLRAGRGFVGKQSLVL